MTERGAAEAVRYARALGFDGVEPYPCPAFQTTAQARELGHILREENMAVPCVSLGIDLSGEQGRDSVDRLKRLVDMTAACGAPLLHHTLVPGLRPTPVGAPSFERVFDEVAERAGEVADYAARAGLRVIYEDQGFFFNGAERFARFLAALDRPNTGICADFGNILFADETPESFIGRFSDRILHVHVKDYLYKPGSAPCPGRGWLRTRSGGWLRDTIPGHGVIDMVACLSILAGAGYNGFYSLEFGGPEPFEEGTRQALENLSYYEALAAHTI